MELKFKNNFLDLYLKYVEDTESPRLFHIFSALSGVGACLGRRCYLPFGFKNLYPNLYIAIVGPPGVRKSTAINITRRLLGDVTNVKFAPDDTGGQRQGLMSALAEEDIDDPEMAALMSNLDQATSVSIEALSGAILVDKPDPADRYVMYATAAELCSLIGTNQIELMTFLNKMFDGDSYKYKLSKTEISIKNGLMSLIGGITSEQIAATFPPAAIGHGFTSRMLLVYQNKKYKSVFPIPKPDPILEAQLQNLYSKINHDMHGEFTYGPGASKYSEELYRWQSKLDDPRFIHYQERRFDHLAKLAMCLAAGRESMTIEIKDLSGANSILQAAETCMPDALGEYGNSKLALAKQRLIDTLRHVKQAIPVQMLFDLVSKDMPRREFLECVQELVNAERIMQITLPQFGHALVYRDTKTVQVEELLAELVDTDDIGNIIPLRK